MYIQIKTTENTKDFALTYLLDIEAGSMLELSHKDIDACFPIPWDADVTIKDGTVIMSGGAAECGWGSCKTTFPAKSFPEHAMVWQAYVASCDHPILARLESLGLSISPVTC